MTLISDFSIDSTCSARHSPHHITAHYDQVTTSVSTATTPPTVTTSTHRFHLRTDKEVPKLGLLLVGWGGNNGSTATASILANRHNVTWNTKEGVKTPNYFGSLLMSSTARLGVDPVSGKDVFIPLHSMLPMVHPNDIEVGGWDISSMDLALSMFRGRVLDHDLQKRLTPYMSNMKPMPSVYYPEFIAANQSDRADNVLPGIDKAQHLDTLRGHIRQFKKDKGLNKVIVLWTATTERFSSLIEGINDTSDNLMKAIKNSHSEIAPSTLFAVASILEGATFINGSPQNTLVPGCVELAEKKGVFVAGDDFKSGQTKFKSVMMDFLVGAGIRPRSIVSYNHLGNNDGKNLSAPQQFRSKEISKSNVVDDIVSSNAILYPKVHHHEDGYHDDGMKVQRSTAEDGGHPDHTVVIKYVPSVGDSKRALDEYESDIFMNGRNTIVVHNTCEDSLLATPLILDLAIMSELCERISYQVAEDEEGEVKDEGYRRFNTVLSVLSYWLKAPLVPKGAPIVNALFKQRACIENLFRICSGLPVETDLRLEHRTSLLEIGINGLQKKHGNGVSNGNVVCNVNGISNGK